MSDSPIAALRAGTRALVSDVTEARGAPRPRSGARSGRQTERRGRGGAPARRGLRRRRGNARGTASSTHPRGGRTPTTRRDCRRAEARERRRALLPFVLVGTGLAVAGALLVVPGDPRDRGGAGTAPPAPVTGAGTAGTEQRADASDDDRPAGGPGATAPEADPAAALLALTAARERAYETGDAAALSGLTIPGSPAAAAEDPAAVEHFRGTDVVLDLVVERTERPASDRAEVEGVLVSGTSENRESTRLVFRLQFADDGWRVHEVLEP